jgi:sulfatase modifying factor 1
MRRRAFVLAAVLAGGAGLVVLAALRGARDGGAPLRCAEGMIALGARCCGEGQALEGGRCAGAPSRCGPHHEVTPAGCAPLEPNGRRAIAGGRLRIGPGDWEAQGVVAPYEADVAPFSIDTFEVTEARWEPCVRVRACPDGPALSGEPGRAIAGVTFEEAEAFCRFAGGRLPSRDELAFAISGDGRRYPWGDTGVVCRRAAWGLASGPCASGGAGPDTAGAHPAGASAAGVQDLAGNVAEWTASRDAPEGCADVVGGSWADAEAASLRGWNRRTALKAARDPAVGFRCVYTGR